MKLNLILATTVLIYNPKQIINVIQRNAPRVNIVFMMALREPL